MFPSLRRNTTTPVGLRVVPPAAAALVAALLLGCNTTTTSSTAFVAADPVFQSGGEFAPEPGFEGDAGEVRFVVPSASPRVSVSGTGGGFASTSYATNPDPIAPEPGFRVVSGEPRFQVTTTTAVAPRLAANSFVLLPNTTAIVGENYLAVRPSGGFGQAGLRQMLRAASPAPPPFETVIVRDFRTSADAFGPFHYVELRPGGGVTCAYALRQTPAAPGGTIVLRNCVQGSLQAALAPINRLDRL